MEENFVVKKDDLNATNKTVKIEKNDTIDMEEMQNQL